MNTKVVAVSQNKKQESLESVEFKLSTNDSTHYKYKIIAEDQILNKKYTYVFSVSKEEIKDSSITRVIKYSQNEREVVKCKQIKEDRFENVTKVSTQVNYNKQDDLFVNFYKVENWRVCYYHFIENVSNLVMELIPTKASIYRGILPNWNMLYTDTYKHKTWRDIVVPVCKLMPNLPTRLFFDIADASSRGEKPYSSVDYIINDVKRITKRDDLRVVVLQNQNSNRAMTRIVFYDIMMPNLQACKDFIDNYDYKELYIYKGAYTHGYPIMLGTSINKMTPFVYSNNTENKTFKYLCLQPELSEDSITDFIDINNRNIKSGCTLSNTMDLSECVEYGLSFTKEFNDKVALCNLTRKCPICNKQEDEHNFLVNNNYLNKGFVYNSCSLGCMKSKHDYDLIDLKWETKIKISEVISLGIELPTRVKVNKKLSEISNIVTANTLAEVKDIEKNNEIGEASKSRLIKLRYASILLKEFSQLEDIGIGSESYNTLKNYNGYKMLTLEQLQQGFINLYKSEELEDSEFKKIVYKGVQRAMIPKDLPSTYNWKKMINVLKKLMNEETYNFDIVANKPYKGKAITSLNFVPSFS